MKADNDGEEWFLLFRAGDRQAFRTVFDKYYRSVSYFAAKVLRDDVFAEDIVSESFRKAWDRRDKFASPRHLQNFLFLVTRNGCISHLRSDKVNQSTAKEWTRMAEDTEKDGTPLDLERVQAQLLEAIFEKLNGMPGGDVLRMAYLEGKSTKEIAAELDISENNVYIIKSRSLKALRNMLTRKEWMFFALLFLHS